jgi:pSer/pThr/pTyr-binding forkhead associated (FHA) protein
MWALVVDRGRHKGKIFPIRISPLKIGRDDDCQLRTSHPYVSHRHCELLTEGDKIILRDCNSTNGTFINGQKVEQRAELHEGDRLNVGPMSFVLRQTGNGEEKVRSAPENDPSAAKPPKPNRAVDEDTVGEMLLEMDEKPEPNEAPPGNWKKESAENPNPSTPRASSPRESRDDQSRSSRADKVASQMLKGKGDWLKRRSPEDD